MTETYRPELPPLPPRLRRRPVQRGYPVPWFVARLDDGSYEFRVADGKKAAQAVKERRCWVCGDRLGGYLAFPIGPMCAITRTTAEPPSHRECALWSAQACPFLNQQMSRRREGGLPEAATAPAGEMLRRQAGAVAVWITRSYRLFGDGNGGVLFRVGDPLEVLWFSQGRPATRAEVQASIDGGYPSLLALAEQDGPKGMAALEAAVARALVLLPQQEEVPDAAHAPL